MKFLLLTLLSLTLATAAFSQEPVVKAINNPDPAFPPEAKDITYGQEVKVAIRVNKKGEVTEARAWGLAVPCSNRRDPVARSIENAAVTAAREMTFAPIIKGGKPAEMDLVITYRLRPASQPQTEPGATPKLANAGVINGKALSLPKPDYPAIARANGAAGTVSVKVLISEDGRVISAAPISGHPLLHQSVVDSACGARFAPVILQGNPIKVTGTITYNFVP